MATATDTLTKTLTMISPENLEKLPPTLMDWRSPVLCSAYETWGPLTSWFTSQGIELFVNLSGNNWSPYVCPPTRVARAHDGNYTIESGLPPMAYPNLSTMHTHGRTVADGRFVLIRLIAKGDQGLDELGIQRYVSSSNLSFMGENHCLIMQRELSLEDMTFGIFAVQAEGLHWPWYVRISEVFDASIQLLEGIEFLHRHLIAHRDIGAENILINFAGDSRAELYEDGRSFRSSFPIRYSFIDFELSVQFPMDSKPEDRVVSGLPTTRIGIHDHEDYGRDLAPEMIQKKPYDPFKTDIFQMGKMLHDCFHVLAKMHPALVQILESMMAETPGARPTAKEALDMVRAYKDTLTGAQLKEQVPDKDIPGPKTIEAVEKEHEEQMIKKAARKATEALEAEALALIPKPAEAAHIIPPMSVCFALSLPILLAAWYFGATVADRGLMMT